MVNEKNFSYWVLKPGVDVQDIIDEQEAQGDSFDVNTYCDSVSLISEMIEEIDLIIRSYVNYNNLGMLPHLPGAPEHLQAYADEDEEEDEDSEVKASIFSGLRGFLNRDDQRSASSAGNSPNPSKLSLRLLFYVLK